MGRWLRIHASLRTERLEVGPPQARTFPHSHVWRWADRARGSGGGRYGISGACLDVLIGSKPTTALLLDNDQMGAEVFTNSLSPLFLHELANQRPAHGARSSPSWSRMKLQCSDSGPDGSCWVLEQGQLGWVPQLIVFSHVTSKGRGGYRSGGNPHGSKTSIAH